MVKAAGPVREPGTYTAAEVASILQVSEAHVYKLAHDGEIPCKYLGRRVVFPIRRFTLWLDGDVDSPAGGHG